MSINKCALELKALLKQWKLDRLYETLKDEDIFLEELEMMTNEHLETILKHQKMGVRIKFEYHFKKWRAAIGAPLEEKVKNEKCCNCCQQNKEVNKKLATKTINKAEKATQTESVNKIIRNTKNNTLSVLNGANHMGEVIAGTSEEKVNNQQRQQQQQEIEPTTSTSIKEIAAINHSALVEQPTTTTFHDAPKSPKTKKHTMPAPESNNSRSELTDPTKKICFELTKKLQVRKPETLLQPSAFLKLYSKRNAVLKAQKEDATPKPLIPKASLKRHLTCANAEQSAATGGIFLSNLSVFQKYCAQSLEFKRKHKNQDGNIVVDILLSESNQGFQLLQNYEENKIFTAKERELLIKKICEHYHREKIHFSSKISDSLLEQILELFPSEKAEYYKDNSCGKIYKQYYDIKKESMNETVEIILSDTSDSEGFMDEINLIVNKKTKIETQNDAEPSIPNLDQVKLEYTKE